MVRIATVNDAEQLKILNNEFNGEGETSIDNIRNSLMNNKQEVVIVADEDDRLVGFVCVQLKKSFCYDEYMPEITEVYVKPAYRKRGLASEMITFAEAYCSKNYPLDKYELLTGQENLVAQTVYNKLRYMCFCERRPFFFRTSVVNLITVSHKTICACRMDSAKISITHWPNDR